MDIWYKPKYTISLNDPITISNNDIFVYQTFSALDEDLGDALFQLEVANIIEPNENMEFNISKIFNHFIDNHENTNIKKLLKIEQFNILFYINAEYVVIWPERAENMFVKHILIEENTSFSMLTFDEFMVKSLLE